MNKLRILFIVILLLCFASIIEAGPWQTDYDELAETPASNDIGLIVDVSDTTMNALGTTKWISYDWFGVPDLVTLTGVAAQSVDLGTFTGSIISDNVTIKSALQELETELATKSYSASPVFTGTVTLPSLVTMPTTGQLRPATTTDTHYIALTAHNGTDWVDVVRIVNDAGGQPEFQLQSGVAFTGIGIFTLEDEGIIRNETDTSDDYSRWQATDEVGGVPAQVDAIRVTNAGVAGEISVRVGDGGGANYWQIDQSGDMTPAGTATFQLPAVTPASTAKIAYDSTSEQVQYYGAASVRAISPKYTYSAVVQNVVDTDDMMFVKLPYGITAVSLDCIVTAATSATINIVECNGTGTCSDEMATSDLVCDTDGANTTAFAGAAGSGADSGDWLQLKIESTSGSPGTLTVTLTYTIVAD